MHFLKQLNQDDGIAYNSAHAILGKHYYNIKEYRLQRESLEIATKKGPHRSEPKTLLSLAQVYGHMKQYPLAVKTLKRAEAKMRRLTDAEKANLYKSYIEYLRLYYMTQRAQNPLSADSSPLD